MKLKKVKIGAMFSIIKTKNLEKLKKELADRLEIVRKDIANRMHAAKEQGDLSENAEYSEAREDQWKNDARIEELRNLIKGSEIVEDKHDGKIDVGTKVKLKSDMGIEIFTIVSSEGVDLAKKMISYQSPLGQSLMGKKSGDEVVIQAPKGRVKYQIIKVE